MRPALCNCCIYLLTDVLLLLATDGLFCHLQQPLQFLHPHLDLFLVPRASCLTFQPLLMYVLSIQCYCTASFITWDGPFSLSSKTHPFLYSQQMYTNLHTLFYSLPRHFVQCFFTPPLPPPLSFAPLHCKPTLFISDGFASFPACARPHRHATIPASSPAPPSPSPCH